MAAKRAHRRNVSRSTAGSMPESAGQTSGSTTESEQDEFDKHKQEMQQSLKDSKEYVEKQGQMFVSRDERHYRLMNIFDKMQQKDKLDLDSFYS